MNLKSSGAAKPSHLIYEFANFSQHYNISVENSARINSYKLEHKRSKKKKRTETKSIQYTEVDATATTLITTSEFLSARSIEDVQEIRGGISKTISSLHTSD